MKVTNINEGLNLYSLNTDKFKTFTLSLYFHRELKADEASYNALLPYVLKRGSKNYKDSKTISKELESLYGGTFDTFVRKKGENQVIGISFEFISPRYIKNDPDYSDRTFKFIFDIILNPETDENGFNAEYVEREKENLCDYINGFINDKKEYAIKRCTEEMCKGEPYALFEYGDVNKVNEITPKSLFEHYKKVISESKIDVFTVGDIDINNVVLNLKKIPRENVRKNYPKTTLKEKSNDVNEVTEKLDVAQGKLCMGFSVGVKNNDEKIYALTLMNSIFGSGAHSKLFNNVREKLSLCYYAYSRLDKFKGIMTVNSGVEFKNFKKAYDEILLQLENIKNAKVTDEEIEFSKNSIKNTLLSISDNPFSIEEYYLNCAIGGNIVPIETYIKKIEDITLSEIVKVAKNVNLHTVYYLTVEEN